MKRTVGRRLKLAFNVDDILAAMTRIYGDPKESWRAVNGFWGKLAMELGLKNKILVRKNLNTRWIEDRRGVRSEYAKMVKGEDETRAEDDIEGVCTLNTKCCFSVNIVYGLLTIIGGPMKLHTELARLCSLFTILIYR